MITGIPFSRQPLSFQKANDLQVLTTTDSYPDTCRKTNVNVLHPFYGDPEALPRARFNAVQDLQAIFCGLTRLQVGGFALTRPSFDCFCRYSSGKPDKPSTKAAIRPESPDTDRNPAFRLSN